MTAEILRIAAFSDGDVGGNPAGVHLSNEHPPVSSMQAIAADVGYSETAFAEPNGEGWRVRYFSPESEVPFCGHATIALGAALTQQNGPGVFSLSLNEANITVEGFQSGESYAAALQSPSTSSKPAEPQLLQEALALFNYSTSDLDPNLPASFAHGGANHLVIGLKSRELLKSMHYDLSAGRDFMNTNELITVMFAYSENLNLFHTRNAFASGGVLEDPATGAATAAFAGYLRDIGWQHGGEIDLIQGEDMGARSLIQAQFSDQPGTSIRVSGSIRFMA